MGSSSQTAYHKSACCFKRMKISLYSEQEGYPEGVDILFTPYTVPGNHPLQEVGHK
jgi:hypothetical protein